MIRFIIANHVTQKSKDEFFAVMNQKAPVSKSF